MSLKSQCPNCSKVLTLKTSAALGKRVPCPKCKEPFVVAKFKEEELEVLDDDEYDDYEDDAYDDYDDYEEDYDDYEDDYDDYEQPRRRSRPAAKPAKGRGSKKKRKSGGGIPPWVYGAIGGTVAVALLIAAGLFLASSLGGLGGNVMDLTYLPENADLFIYVEPSAIMDAEMLAPLKEQQQFQVAMDRAKNDMPAAFNEIASVTMAGVDSFDKQRVNLFGGGRVGPVQRADQKLIGVMRFRKDITGDDIKKMRGFSEAKYNNQDYYVNMPSSMAFWLADSRTAVFGTTSEVNKAMERGPKEPRIKRIDFASVDHQFVMIIAPEKVIPEEGSATGTTSFDQLERTMSKAAKGMFVGVSVGSGIDVEVGVQCQDSSQAETLKGDFDKVVAEGKAKLNEAGASNPPEMQALFDSIQKTMDSVSVSKSGQLVSMSAKVPPEISKAIEDLSKNPLMMMGMAAAMQNMGGGPPGFGGPAQGPFGAQPGQPIGTSPSLGTGKLNLELKVNFTGNGDALQAAQNALASVQGVENVTYDPATQTLKMLVPAIGLGPAKVALSNAGFTITGQSMTPAL